MKPNSALVIIPTFNEADNIGSLLLKVTRDVPELDILVVDDNSPDGTASIVSRFVEQDSRVHLLSRPSKNGLASAYIAGFDWALQQYYDRIIQMDADFSHNPVYLRPMLEALEHNDMALGARYVKGGGTSGWGALRKLISRGGNLYAKTVLGLPYQDLTGGFVAWRRSALKSIDYRTLKSRGYAFQVELKFRAHRSGMNLKEIPIHFANRKFGQSKMSSMIVWEAALRVLQLKRSAIP